MGKIDLMIELERGDLSKKKERKKRYSSTESSQSEQDDQDDHLTDIYKDHDLYLAAKNGNLDDFKAALDRGSAAENIPRDVILRRLSPAGNTFLHVAAAAKKANEDIVTFVCALNPSLALSTNFDGETALHVAARAGDEPVVKALVLVHQDSPAENSLLRAKNNGGSTAVHEALSNGWSCIAEYLIEQDPELSYDQNKDGESALYLAARAGFVDCVASILRLSTDEGRVNGLFKKKSPIRAAIKEKRRAVLEAMLNTKPSLVQTRDCEGKTPLHHAASYGHHEDVRYLLDKFPGNATQRDKSGSFPIHLASIKGYVEVIRLLLQDFPEPAELLDREGRNVLHVAAKNGRSNVVRFVLENRDLDELINMKDKRGNTPLHVATMHWHPKIVHALTWDKRVDIRVLNGRGMTALDVAEDFMPFDRRYTMSLTWAALKAADTPRSQSYKTAGTRKKFHNRDRYKERVNTLLLVSTLVATVTFAAGFTVPGGYNSSESVAKIGEATLLRETGFHVFVFCDTIAMYSSIIVAVVLIWAQLGDLALVLNVITLSVPLLGIALIMMSVAFMAGILVVVGKLKWLASAVLIMGFAFTAILFLLILLLCSPLTSRNRVLRYLSYYPFYLLILASGG